MAEGLEGEIGSREGKFGRDDSVGLNTPSSLTLRKTYRSGDSMATVRRTAMQAQLQ